MSRSSFINRFSINQRTLTYDSFPDTARNGLVHIIIEILQKDNRDKSREEWKRISQCLHKSAKKILYKPSDDSYRSQFLELLATCAWYYVYEFCEAYYANVIDDSYYYDNNERILTYPQEENRKYFADEINSLMQSEYIGYEFKDGHFHRKGYSRTQASINKSNQVLSAPKLAKAKKHYNKALGYFSSKNANDAENCIKEAICALEAALNALYSPNTANNFSKEVLGLAKPGPNQVPRPIIDAMVKIYGYRNSAAGVAHSPDNGFVVSFQEAELILGLIGDYITYFYDKLYIEDDIPF